MIKKKIRRMLIPLALILVLAVMAAIPGTGFAEDIPQGPLPPVGGTLTIVKTTTNGLTGFFTFMVIDNSNPTSGINLPLLMDVPGTKSVSTNLPAGNYTVKEFSGLNTNMDYEITVPDSSGIYDSVDVTTGNNTNVYFTNEGIVTGPGVITINKATTNGLTGIFYFTIAKNDGSYGPVDATIDMSTPGTGSTTVGSLPPGIYTVTETGGSNTNMDYDITNWIFSSIEVTSGSNTDIYFTNEGLAPGSITIHKETTNGLTGTFDFTISKNDGSYEPVDASIDISTPGTGSTTVGSLPPGIYTVTEAGSSGASMDYAITVPDPSGTYSNVEVTLGSNTDVYFTNQGISTDPGTITINKTTTNGLTGTFDFTVIKDDGSYGPVDVTIKVETPGTKSITVENLPPGTYIVAETGVADTNMEYVITVPGPLGTYRSIEVISNSNTDVAFTNEGIPVGKITLNKSGLDNNSTAGFILYNVGPNGIAESKGGDDWPVVYYGEYGGTIIEKFITGSDTVIWADLPYGTYYIIENTVPEGYIPMDEITGIVISPSQNEYNFNRTNTILDPSKGGAIILQVAGLKSNDSMIGYTLFSVGANGIPENGTGDDIRYGIERYPIYRPDINSNTEPFEVIWDNVPFGTYYILNTSTFGGYYSTAIGDIVIDQDKTYRYTVIASRFGLEYDVYSITIVKTASGFDRGSFGFELQVKERIQVGKAPFTGTPVYDWFWVTKDSGTIPYYGGSFTLYYYYEKRDSRNHPYYPSRAFRVVERWTNGASGVSWSFSNDQKIEAIDGVINNVTNHFWIDSTNPLYTVYFDNIKSGAY